MPQSQQQNSHAHVLMKLICITLSSGFLTTARFNFRYINTDIDYTQDVLCCNCPKKKTVSQQFIALEPNAQLMQDYNVLAKHLKSFKCSFPPSPVKGFAQSHANLVPCVPLFCFRAALPIQFSCK